MVALTSQRAAIAVHSANLGKSCVHSASPENCSTVSFVPIAGLYLCPISDPVPTAGFSLATRLLLPHCSSCLVPIAGLYHCPTACLVATAFPLATRLFLQRVLQEALWDVRKHKRRPEQINHHLMSHPAWLTVSGQARHRWLLQQNLRCLTLA